MSDTDPDHRRPGKNGRDQTQDFKIRDLQSRMDKNDADHSKIDEKINYLITDAKARTMLRKIGLAMVSVLLAGLGWFVGVTLKHAWVGEKWGNELRRDIDQNHEAIEELQNKE